MSIYEKSQNFLNGTMRKCISSGDVKDTSALLRFVVGPEGYIVADVLGKLPGKGIWVTCERAAIKKATRERLFSNAARKAVKVSETLIYDVEKLITERVISLLSLARKSGHAVAGYEKVKSWLSKEVAHVLIQSCEGSTRGKSKLSTPKGVIFIGWLGSAELSLAFGRETVIHCALASGGITQRVVNEARRLKGLRIVNGDLRVVQKEKTAI